MISPRLTDPKSEIDSILSLFRFSEEKTQVEEALKARAQALEKQRYSAAIPPVTPNKRADGKGPGRGGGGRGRGGRGVVVGSSRPMSAPREFTLPITGGDSDLNPLSMSDESFPSSRHIQLKLDDGLDPEDLDTEATGEEDIQLHLNGTLKPTEFT